MKSTQTKQKQNDLSEKTGVLRSLRSRLGWRSRRDKPENSQIDYLINTIEPQLKHIRGYRKRLHEPLKICLEHCKAIVDEIPGPINLQRARYYDNPLIKAAFAGTDRIEHLLDRADGKTSRADLAGKQRVALLTMRSKEKTIFGSKRQGNMIIGDTAMRAITFTDHNLVGLATTLENSKKELEKYCLEIITEAAARELSEIRTRLVDLRQRQERLRAMKKMFGEGKKAGMGAVFVPLDLEKHDKQKKLDQMLVETKSEIAVASEESETPENWLSIIENFLSKPEDILSLQVVSLRLDWCNVLTEDPKEKANTITFATFTLADEMQREGVLVSYENG